MRKKTLRLIKKCSHSTDTAFSVGMEMEIQCAALFLTYDFSQIKVIHPTKQGRGELNVIDLWDVLSMISS